MQYLSRLWLLVGKWIPHSPGILCNRSLTVIAGKPVFKHLAHGTPFQRKQGKIQRTCLQVWLSTTGIVLAVSGSGARAPANGGDGVPGNQHISCQTGGAIHGTLSIKRASGQSPLFYSSSQTCIYAYAARHGNNGLSHARKISGASDSGRPFRAYKSFMLSRLRQEGSRACPGLAL